MVRTSATIMATVGLALVFLADRCQATIVGEDDFESYGALNPAPNPLDGTAAGGLLWNYIDGQGDGIADNDHRTFFSPGGAGAGMASVGWISLEDGGGIDTSISLASLAGTAFDDGSGGIVNGSAFTISFTTAAETSNTGSDIGFNYNIASSGGSLGFLSGSSADGSTIFNSLTDGGIVSGGTTGASDDRLMSVLFDATGVALADTISFSFTRTLGTNNPFIFFDDFVLDALDGLAEDPELVINRDTGNIALGNNTISNVDNIIGYSILSAAGGLDQTNWDQQATGSQLANDNDDWTVLTAPGADTDLSEAVLASSGDGDGGDLLTSALWNYGDVWKRSPFEDIDIEILLDDGTVLRGGTDVTISFTGNNDMPYALGDLNTDGDVDVLDWNAFQAGYGTDLTGLSLVEAYLAADMNADGVHSLLDFREFETAYDAVNGDGAFQLLVPEPTGVCLLMLAAFGILSVRRRQVAVHQWIVPFLLVGCCCTLADAQPLDSTTFTFQYDGSDIFNGVSVVAPWALNGGIEADDLSLNGTNLLITPLAGSDDEDNNGWIEQDGGATPWDTPVTGIVNQPRWALDVTVNLNDLDSGLNDNITLWAEGGGNRQIFIISGNSVSTFGGTVLDTSDNTDGLHAFQLQFDATDTTAGAGGTYQLYRDGVLIGADLPRESGQGLSRLIVGDCCTSLGNPVDEYEIGHVRFDVNTNDLLTLTVNPTTGAATISSDSAAALEVDSYAINSAAESLTPGSWSTLEDNPAYGNGIPGDGIGFEVISATSTQLAEANLTGFATFNPSDSVSIGNVFTPGMPQDLVFTLGLESGAILEANVVYETTPGINGDFNMDGMWDCDDIDALVAAIASGSTDLSFDMNGDGAINAGDITDPGNGWLAVGGANNPDDTGGNPFLLGDATLDGIVDGLDFIEWNNNKFMSSDHAVSVPEPTGGMLLLGGMLALCARTRRKSRCDSALTRGTPAMRNSRPWTTAGLALLILTLSLVANGNADVFNDRVYQFGDESFEAGAVGDILGANVPPPFNDGRTLDGMGDSGNGDFQDLFLDNMIPNNAPVYVDTMASGRPGATAGDRLGARFDGDGDSLKGRELNSPNDTWQDLFDDNNQYPNNWSGIFSRGMQLWVRPEASAGMGMAGIGGGLRQDIVTDTGEHGIFISGNDNWGLQFDDAGIESSTPAITGQWTHVMQRSLSGALGGALLVNGVAVAARGTFYDPEAGDMSVGANQDLTGNYFKGELDELTMFVWGNNSGITPGPGEPAGMDWGQIDLGQDNEWIQQELFSLGVTNVADVNLDTMVDIDDETAFVAGWRSENLVNGVRVGDWISRQSGDLNYDGIVDLEDAFILHEGLLVATGQGLNFDLLVPEPSSSLLIAFAVLGLLSRRLKNG